MKTDGRSRRPRRGTREGRNDQARAIRRTQLAADVVQSRDRPGLHSGAGCHLATPTIRRSSRQRADGISVSIWQWLPALPAPSRSLLLDSFSPGIRSRRRSGGVCRTSTCGTVARSRRPGIRVPGQRRRPLCVSRRYRGQSLGHGGGQSDHRRADHLRDRQHAIRRGDGRIRRRDASPRARAAARARPPSCSPLAAKPSSRL